MYEVYIIKDSAQVTSRPPIMNFGFFNLHLANVH